MSKFSYTLPAILIAIIAIGIAAWSFLKVGNTPTNPTKTTTTTDFPINLPNKSVASVNITYSFVGTLTEIKNNSQGTELITDIKIPKLPKFVVSDKKTRVIDTRTKPMKNVPISSLKKGQKVRILASYFIDPKLGSKLWLPPTMIYIFPN